MVHVDGDQEDLEKHEVQQGQSDFLCEMERLKETPASIDPEKVDPTEDTMQVEGRIADRRKRRKPERFLAGPASCKRAVTGCNLNVVNFLDNIDEANVERLKQKYSLLTGYRPKGPYASKVSWLRAKVAELETSTAQMSSLGEDTKKGSATHRVRPQQPNSQSQSQCQSQSRGASLAMDSQQGHERINYIQHSSLDQQSKQPPASASQIAGPPQVQVGDKILYKFHLTEWALTSDEREQWFIGTVRKTGKEDVGTLPPKPNHVA